MAEMMVGAMVASWAVVLAENLAVRTVEMKAG